MEQDMFKSIPERVLAEVEFGFDGRDTKGQKLENIFKKLNCYPACLFIRQI